MIKFAALVARAGRSSDAQMIQRRFWSMFANGAHLHVWTALGTTDTEGIRVCECGSTLSVRITP